MCEEKCEFCSGKMPEPMKNVKKQKGPFGRNGELLFGERGVSAGGSIIGTD